MVARTVSLSGIRPRTLGSRVYPRRPTGFTRRRRGGGLDRRLPTPPDPTSYVPTVSREGPGGTTTTITAVPLLFFHRPLRNRTCICILTYSARTGFIAYWHAGNGAPDPSAGGRRAAEGWPAGAHHSAGSGEIVGHLMGLWAT